MPIDPDLHIATTGHYFFQRDKTHTWKPVTGAHLNSLLASPYPPIYRTVLAQAEAYDESKAALFSGPLYIDLDVSENMGGTATAIQQANQLLSNLVVLGVNLDQIRIFASGGKGFHIEIPTAIFTLGLTPSSALPAIYKEIVHQPSIYVDGIDSRVYSARKGRMWRVPNVERENGRFKVPVSPDQIHSMTPDDYKRLTSEPQPWPQLSPPEYCPNLGVAFLTARDKVAAVRSRAVHAPKAATALKARFGGNFPPCARGLLQGRFDSPVGWNQICVQIAATARACGLSLNDLIRQAGPLIEKHRGDGSRYRTARERTEELKHQYECTNYAFSVGGLRSILPRGINTRDLVGL